MRVLTIASGILMIAAGAFCFINPGQTFMTMAFVIGSVMVLCGIIHALAYLLTRINSGKGDNNGWIMIDAMLTLLLGALILGNQLTADIVIPMIFGMWVLVSGLLRIEAATRINRSKKPRNFRDTFITGIITVVVGLFGFINPLMSYVPVVGLLGIFMIIQGINSIELGINMPHEVKEDVVVYKKPREAVKIDDDRDESQEAVVQRIAEQRKAAQEKELVKAMATESIGLSKEETEQAIREAESERAATEEVKK